MNDEGKGHDLQQYLENPDVEAVDVDSGAGDIVHVKWVAILTVVRRWAVGTR